MKEAGLDVLSGERQRVLQEQLDNARTSLVNTKEESKDKKMKVANNFIASVYHFLFHIRLKNAKKALSN